MLHLLPAARDLPSWAQTLAELGHPPAKDLARLLGVTTRTLDRWAATDRAPRTALLALYPLTRWGMGAAELQLLRERNDLAALAACLKREKTGLEALVSELAESPSQGAANSPIWDVGTAVALRGAGRRPTAAASSPAMAERSRRWPPQ